MAPATTRTCSRSSVSTRSRFRHFSAPTIEAGYYGTYYAAFFVTVSKFIVNEMTLSVSGLSDLSDSSGIGFIGLAYDPVNNFELSLQLGYVSRSRTTANTPSP